MFWLTSLHTNGKNRFFWMIIFKGMILCVFLAHFSAKSQISISHLQVWKGNRRSLLTVAVYNPTQQIWLHLGVNKPKGTNEFCHLFEQNLTFNIVIALFYRIQAAEFCTSSLIPHHHPWQNGDNYTAHSLDMGDSCFAVGSYEAERREWMREEEEEEGCMEWIQSREAVALWDAVSGAAAELCAQMFEGGWDKTC